MSGFGARDAEVRGGGDDAGAEEVVPDAVGHDAGGEGVVGFGEPLSKFFPSDGVFRTRVETEVAFHNGEAGGWDFVARIFRTAAVENLGGSGLGEAADEGVARAFFGEGMNVPVESLGGGLEIGVLIEGLASLVGAGEVHPGAVFLLGEDAETGEISAGHFFEVVGFESVFAVA